MDYKSTLNLPKTSFPMKANLVKKEPQFLEYWKSIDIYNYVLKNRENAPKFVLHDGPPYANGNIHLGTAMNKILKDAVIKYKTHKGYKTPYIPGWDTHGLPIEHRVVTELGEKASELSPAEIRKKCENFAMKYVDIQKEEFIRLGVRGDWENPYLTLSPEYEAGILEVLKTLVEKGLVYRQKKPIFWCYHCKTALAEAEIEYYDHTSTSIYVKFPLKDEKDKYILIWTTTPWTLPANMGIALHPDYDYVEVKVDGEIWVLAKALLETVMEKAGKESYEVLREFKGKEYEGKKAVNPLFEDRTSLVILADYVTLDTGTGCVHTAPGHGEEDYYTGHVEYGLEVFSPVDDEGRFTKEAGKYEGLFIEDANKEIISDLKEKGYLLAEEKITHSYPHCWRCKNPVIFRATEQWFISLDKNNYREEAIKAINEVQWIPEWGKNRIESMVKERPDWCISRQRMWGVPIPALKCEDCGEEFLSEEFMENFIKIVKEKGTNAWFEMSEEELIPNTIKCPKCGSQNLKKTYNTLDVWIDSGSSFEAVLRKSNESLFPADMYLEGSDQHRGWFQSSLWLSVARTGRAPYKQVLTHGFIKDEQGRAMSKSLGNVISPLEITEKYGADVLRLWVMSVDYFNDVRISFNIIKQLVEVYKKIRNTFRYMLGNLFDFEPEKDALSYEELEYVDKWMIHRLNEVIKSVTSAYEKYEFSKAYNTIVKFITNDLSSLYLDITKDRLYVEHPESKKRRSAQTVIFRILHSLMVMLSPFLTFTMEEVYQHLPESVRKFKTIQLENWPEVKEEFDEKLMGVMEVLLKVREDALKALEEKRVDGVIGHPLDAKVVLWSDDEKIRKLLKEHVDELKELLIVSQLEVKETNGYEGEIVKVEVLRASGEKCERCWKYDETVGEDPEHPTLCKRCAEIIRNTK